MRMPAEGPHHDTTAGLSETAQRALDHLVRALKTGSRAQTVAVAAPSEGQLLGWIHHNAAALRIRGLSMRYLGDGAPVSVGEHSVLGPRAWRGEVQVGYRYDGLDQGPAHVRTSAVFVPTAHGAWIASFGAPGDRAPLWLVDRLSVVRTPVSLLAVAGGPPGRYPALVSRALRQVQQVLPTWRGPLLVEVPRTRAQLDAALQAQPGQYDGIAAVTTTADGSLDPEAPVRVYVNPRVVIGLEDRSAQIVITHEAVHVATGAALTSTPTWLREGFADFVALDRAGVPLRLAAGQILPRIRRHGLPPGLPTRHDLETAASGLGAAYEEAWLACRFLAQEYGVKRLTLFYDIVSGGASTQDTFGSVLHTTQAAFVARWRRDLSRLAGVAR